MDEQFVFEDRDRFQYKHPRIYWTVRITAIVLIVIFSFATLFNMYLLVNGFFRQNGFPAAHGITPIVVEPSEDADAESLEDYVSPGDLLLVYDKDLKDYEEGELVAFTHHGVILIGKITEIEERRGSVLVFNVQAAYHDNPFVDPSIQNSLIGSVNHRIPAVGYFLIFISSLPGRLILVGIPLLIYLILLFVEAWLEAEAYRRARRTFLRPGTFEKVPLPEVALWSYLSTSLFVLAAIRFGTHDSRRTDKRLAKAAAAAHTPVPRDRFTIPVTRPVRMRRNRPLRRTHRAKPLRAVRPVPPVTPILPQHRGD